MDRILGIANLVGFIALVLITGYYAYQNRKIVQEMRAARQYQTRPMLKLSLVQVTPTVALPRATNVGLGPAIDPRITISVANDLGIDSKTAVFQLLMPNDYHEFIYPLGQNNQVMSLEDFANSWQTISLHAECKDTFGGEHVFDNEINIPEFRAYLNETQVRFREDPLEKMSDELEKIRKKLE